MREYDGGGGERKREQKEPKGKKIRSRMVSILFAKLVQIGKGR